MTHRAPAPELDQPATLGVAEHAVHGRTRCARERREVVLDQGDDDRRRPAVDTAELEHAAGDARLGVDRVGLHEPLREERHALGEQAHEDLVQRRVALREPAELGAADDERLAGLERGNRRASFVLRHDGQLAEGLARPADRERDLVAVRCRRRGRRSDPW